MAKLSNNNRPSNTENDALQLLIRQVDELADLYRRGRIDLHEAVDRAQEFAFGRGLVEVLGQDRIQSLLAAAFVGRAQP